MQGLIIDRREGRGGTPETVALICGHLLGREPVHLQDTAPGGRLPIAKSVNAVTGTNWEQVGATPDRPCPPPEAVQVALDELRAS